MATKMEVVSANRTLNERLGSAVVAVDGKDAPHVVPVVVVSHNHLAVSAPRRALE